MRTTWRVTKVTETEGSTVAELVRTSWFKKNPEYVALDAEYDALFAAEGEEACEARFLGVEWPEEFIDAEPGDGKFIDAGDTMTLDISAEDAAELHPGDDVVLDLSVAVSVEA